MSPSRIVTPNFDAKALGSAHDVPALVHPRKRPYDVRFVLEVHGAIGVFPFAQHPEALEVRALQIDLFGCVLTAQPAELRGIDLLADLADLLLDCNFDRQPVAVPTGDIR